MAGYGKDGYGGGSGAAVPYGTPTDAPGAAVPYGVPTDAPVAYPPAAGPGAAVPYGEPTDPPGAPVAYPPADGPGAVPYGTVTDPPGAPVAYPPADGAPVTYPPADGAPVTYPPAVTPDGGYTDPVVYPPPVVGYTDLAKTEQEFKEKLAAAETKLAGAAGDKRVVEATAAVKMYQEGLKGANQAKLQFPDSEGLKTLINQFTTGLEAARAKLDKGDSPSRSPKPGYGDVVNPCALEHFECAKCFAPLHSKPLSVFIGSDGKRSCNHFIHTQCCDLASMKTCPTCEVAFASLKPVPSVATNPTGWFAAVDADGDGALDQEEAFAALASSLPPPPGMQFDEKLTAILKKQVDEKWKEWDLNGDGKITCKEVMVAVTGLRDFMVERLKEEAKKDGVNVYALPAGSSLPQLPNELPGRVSKDEYNAYKAQKEKWYHHWDKDNNNSLDKEEVVRAVVKTFDLSSDDLPTIQGVRNFVEGVWSIWDHDGDNVVNCEEFMQEEDGLGDTLIASLQYLLPKRS